MIDIIDENYDNVETVVIFFDSGNVIQNNETIMKYSPILLQSLSGVDKTRVNGILKKLFKTMGFNRIFCVNIYPNSPRFAID